MKTLTDNQFTFLLDTFFVTHEFAGCRNIGEKLLKNGRCIVAGDGTNLWCGGIGNYIETGETDEAVDCVLLTFDLDVFLKSQLYVQTKAAYMEDLGRQRKDADDKHKAAILRYNEVDSL